MKQKHHPHKNRDVRSIPFNALHENSGYLIRSFSLEVLVQSWDFCENIMGFLKIESRSTVRNVLVRYHLQLM